MNSIGIPTKSTAPNTDVSQGPRIGLFHRRCRVAGKGQAPRPMRRSTGRSPPALRVGAGAGPIRSSWTNQRPASFHDASIAKPQRAASSSI